MLPPEISAEIFRHADNETQFALAATNRDFRQIFKVLEHNSGAVVRQHMPWMRLGCDGHEQETWQDCERLFWERRKKLQDKDSGEFVPFVGNGDKIKSQLGQCLSARNSSDIVLEQAENSQGPPSKDVTFLFAEDQTIITKYSGLELDLKSLKFSHHDRYLDTHMTEARISLVIAKKVVMYKYGSDIHELLGIDRIVNELTEEDEIWHGFPEMDNLIVDNGIEAVFSGSDPLVDNQMKHAIVRYVDGSLDLDNAFVFTSVGSVAFCQAGSATFSTHMKTGTLCYVDVTTKRLFQIYELGRPLEWMRLMEYQEQKIELKVLFEYDGLFWIQLENITLRIFIDLKNPDDSSFAGESEDVSAVVSAPVTRLKTGVAATYYDDERDNYLRYGRVLGFIKDKIERLQTGGTKLRRYRRRTLPGERGSVLDIVDNTWYVLPEFGCNLPVISGGKIVYWPISDRQLDILRDKIDIQSCRERCEDMTIAWPVPDV